MSNKDIVVSSEKGTILNYFGAANTYNPFTNESNMQLVEDLDFKIPERTAIVDAEWVAVSTGLITTSISFLQNCTFQIVDKNSGAKITDLTNIIGEVGNIRFMPSENQIFWFNVDGLRGTFYIHKNHCGHYLKIVSGVFVSTSITSGVLNEMFERSIGVPNYITNINNTLKQQNNIINNFQNQINSLAVRHVTATATATSSNTATATATVTATVYLQIPNNFIGYVRVSNHVRSNYNLYIRDISCDFKVDDMIVSSFPNTTVDTKSISFASYIAAPMGERIKITATATATVSATTTVYAYASGYIFNR